MITTHRSKKHHVPLRPRAGTKPTDPEYRFFSKPVLTEIKIDSVKSRLYDDAYFKNVDWTFSDSEISIQLRIDLSLVVEERLRLRMANKLP